MTRYNFQIIAYDVMAELDGNDSAPVGEQLLPKTVVIPL